MFSCSREHVSLIAASGSADACYVTVTLMTFDKQSNGRRIEVESLDDVDDEYCTSKVFLLQKLVLI